MDGNIYYTLGMMLYFKTLNAAAVTGLSILFIKATGWNFFLRVKPENGKKVMRKSYMLIIFALTLMLITVPDTIRVFKDREKADVFVASCEDYKKKYGRYPEEPEDMVPEYYNKEQLAEFKYGGPSGSHHIRYRCKDGDCHLWYYTGVPFHFNHYNFEENIWVLRGM